MGETVSNGTRVSVIRRFSFITVLAVIARYCLLLLGLWGPISTSAAAHEQTVKSSVPVVKIGVLAMEGIELAMTDWSATAKYLNQRISGHRFVVVPLPFDQLESAVADGQVDFVIANSAIHVMLAEKYQVSPMLTVINRLDTYNASLFGGIVFRRAGLNEPATFAWLKGKHVMAVDRNSLGGFLAAWREWHAQKIDPFKDFASMEFAGAHEAVVRAVLSGRADAGTVRTDVLERMVARGQLDWSQIQILEPFAVNGQSIVEFPYARSTRLYPEWPISRLPKVPDDLARRVAIALLDMKPDSEAAQKAKIAGWNVLASYMPVAALLNELKLPPFESKPFKFLTFVKQQPWITRLILGGLLVTGGLVSVLSLFNRRLGKAQNALLKSNQHLEERVFERTQILERRNMDLSQMATHDALTGLLNRRALDEALIDEINRVNRYGQLLAVLMVDIDWFKKVNDVYGHHAGDVVLREVAHMISGDVRNTDIVARYGGEEFVVLMPMTTTKDAANLADRLRESIAAHMIDVGTDEPARVTVSIGVASAQNSGGDRAHALLDRVDQAMYQAKTNGRNRVCVL